MKYGADVILDYCKNVKTNNIDYLQQCIDNKTAIEVGDYTYLVGCPMNYGLDGYTGLCEIEQVHGFEAQDIQCFNCWKKALEKEL